MTQDEVFLTTITQFYQARARSLPWRNPEPDGSFDVYKILVSEIMLQQTQVSRVIPRYQEFLQAFPTMQSLAAASLPEVLAKWSGLGYNRRAKYLHQTAHHLISKDGPWKYEELVGCPGIGPNTAAAVLAYSYNMPVIFVETNIRTVMIHHFFTATLPTLAHSGRKPVSPVLNVPDVRLRSGARLSFRTAQSVETVTSKITDKEIIDKLGQVVPWGNGSKMSPRTFYWAMMDYGTHLKTTVGNLNKQSKNYTKQSKFEGSKRQIRGQVIRLLLAGPQQLEQVKLQIPDPRLEDVLAGLAQEKLVRFQGKTLMLYNESIKP